MNILINNKQTDLKLYKKKISELVTAILTIKKWHCDEVSLSFVSKKEIAKLHDQFFQDPSPTDCISFPIDDDQDDNYSVLGEIFVCPQVAIEYATKRDLDPYQETTLYIVHGLLHLMGYDDCNPDDRRRMRIAERHIMKKLKTLGIELSL